MTDVQIKQFREILFWPLEIPRLSRRVSQDEMLPLTEAFECSFTNQNRGPWLREADLLTRGDDDKNAAGSRYAELVYFHPFVQRFLYGEGDAKQEASNGNATEHQPQPPMRLYRRDDIKWVRVTLDGKLPEIELAVDRIHFYLFDHGVAILVVEVHSVYPLSLKYVEQFLNRFHRAYPPYWETEKYREYGPAGHCPRKVLWLNVDGSAVIFGSNYEKAGYFLGFVNKNKAATPARHWRYLLRPLQPWKTVLRDIAFAYRQIEDERMSYMAYLSLDDPSQLQRGDFIRLCFADSGGTSSHLPYAYGFLQDFEKTYCYDRFWDPEKRYLQDDPQATPSDHWLTTRYLCCGYGFVMVGKEDHGGFFTDAKNGALSHFRRHYFQMGLIAHFHRAALLLFSDALSEAVGKFNSDHPKPFHDEVKIILGRLLRFTHRYWFHEVSNQVQPRELFALWTKHLETQALFDQVKQEAQDANDFLDMQEQTNMSKATMRLSVVAAIGLPAGLIAAYLAVPWDGLDNLRTGWYEIIGDIRIVGWVAGLVLAAMLLTLWQSERLAWFLDKLSGSGKKPPTKP